MRILIAGAGLSGLTMAAGLRRQESAADIRIFERDGSWTDRPQGYSIGLKGDSGIPVAPRTRSWRWGRRFSARRQARR
jgi:2-polyprenyl-6-methoxyphenol hydroxylase-like FAD-dependent oxidoreductase